jgi:UDP-N-acetylglucosamine 2-epimerase (non-hydrolysing)
MPEEVNRIVTDSIADLLLTPSRDASQSLQREGIEPSKIVFVGNVMIDTLFHSLAAARARKDSVRAGSTDVLVTLHRPSNVDERERLTAILAHLEEIALERRVVFAAHPRTVARMRDFDLRPIAVDVVPPMSYPAMITFMEGCGAVVTDSGGVQEETTALGTPCFTVRESTERPITVAEGTNTVVRDLDRLPVLVLGARRPASPPRLDGWDGSAGQRVVAALLERTAIGADTRLAAREALQ